MMFNSPFFGFPFGRRYPMDYYNTLKLPVDKIDNASKISSNTLIKHYKENDENINFDDYNSQTFNIMGITLQIDDLLIIFLLFFLYSEGVKDDMLFIVLLLLLLG